LPRNNEQEYTATQINDTICYDESFDVIKLIPEFTMRMLAGAKQLVALCACMKKEVEST